MLVSTATDHPQQIGKFPVIRRLGAGAMGEVFLCTQPELERHVAVKVMRGGATHFPRFQREARSAASLVHPYVVRVYDVGIDHESPYIVMEFVDGRPLSELIGSEYLTLPVTLRLLYHVTEALEAAHRQSIIHRDLKPSNILIDAQGRPRLTDFGLAKSLLLDPTLSGSGDLVGTPRYMAPEQILGDNRELDQRVDVFALGVVMYEMLAGRPPFDGTNVVQILRQVTDDDPVDLKLLHPTIPESVASICRKAMAKRPDDRFGSASQVGTALRAVLLAETSTSSDGELRANEYLNAFVPAPTMAAHSLLSNTTVHRPWTGIVATLVLLMASVGGWWFSNLQGVPLPESNPSENFDYEGEKGLLLQEVGRAIRGELRVPEQKTPRDVLKDDLDEATALLLRNKQDDDVRLARARLLRRSGECLAADLEYSTVLKHQPDLLAARVERLLARTQLWGLYLGNWEERLIRYPLQPMVEEDIKLLKESDDATLRHLAALADRLCDNPGNDLLTLVRSAPKEPHELVSFADLSALHVELLSREAEGADVTTSPEAETRPTFGMLAEEAHKSLNAGLKSDPHHVPLLFLRAASYSRRVAWDDADGGQDRGASIRRSLSQFEAAMDRLRRVTLRQGCDTPVARAVLLMNMGWPSSASDQQLQDALSCRPTIPQLQGVRTWFRLRSPEDGTHTFDSLTRLSREFDEKYLDEPDEFLGHYLRALFSASLGRFTDARRPLRFCRTRLKNNQGWLALDQECQRWIEASDVSETALLYATRPIINQLPMSPEVGKRLHKELLERLGNPEIIAAEKISESMLREYRTFTHFTFAEIQANLDDRAGVLEHVRAALEQRSPQIDGASCRDHWAFANWKDDEEFQALFRRFPPAVSSDDAETAPITDKTEPDNADQK